MNAVKIAHVITGLGPGGAEGMLVRLLEGMDTDRYKQVVISLTDLGVYGNRIRALGVPVEVCNLPSGRVSMSGLKKLYHFLKKHKPDVVQTWLYHADFLGGLLARIVGVKRVIWNVRHTNLDLDKNKASTVWVARINGFISRFIPDGIIFNARQSLNVHAGLGYRTNLARVIPNGFDLSRFKPNKRHGLKAILDIDEQTFIVGLVARYDLQKNHDGFIEACRIVVDQCPDIHFVMVGQGVSWENDRLSRKIQESHALKSRLHLLGERDDINEITAGFDLAISFSWGEGFPNAVGEAMACGVPCIVSNVGDSAMLVGDSGWVVEPGDTYALAQHILRISRLPDHERRDRGTKARRRIMEHFSIRAVVDLYQSYYDQIVFQS